MNSGRCSTDGNAEHQDQTSLRRKGFISAFSSTSQSPPEGSKGKNSSRAELWRQKLMQTEAVQGVACCLALAFLQNPGPKSQGHKIPGPRLPCLLIHTVTWVFPHQLRKCITGLPTGQSGVGCFLKWGSQNDSSWCQVEMKLITKVLSNLPRVSQKVDVLRWTCQAHRAACYYFRDTAKELGPRYLKSTAISCVVIIRRSSVKWLCFPQTHGAIPRNPAFLSSPWEQMRIRVWVG